MKQRPVEPQERAYKECRSQFHTGDLLCFRGRGFYAWVIRLLTRSWYSHVGLVYWHRASPHPLRLYCMEARLCQGVRLILMSELKRRYSGGIDYFAVEDVNDEQRDGALAFCFAQLGKLYDKPGIVRFLWAILLGHMEKVRRDDKWFCSELIAAAYKEQGIELVQQDETYTSPEDLAESDRTTYRFTVKADT